jgi:glc operon protein GlcG
VVCGRHHLAFEAVEFDQPEEHFVTHGASPPLIGNVPSLTAAGARAALLAAEREAQLHDWNVCIAVVDARGDLLAFQRMDGVMQLSLDLSQRKARTAVYINAPSAALEERLHSGDHSVLMADAVIAAQGGVPIVIDGNTCGGIGVSGVEARFDTQIAQAGAAYVVAHASQGQR